MDNQQASLSDALKRLSTAIDKLDTAVGQRQAQERTSAARAAEFELMRSDRAKLAEILDQALQRGRSLETACQDADARVERAMQLVQQALSETETK
jgi:hypothetical protein